MGGLAMGLNWINRQNSTARSIALGTFDGVHRGHQKLLEETIARKPIGGTSCVLTFDIPPEQYFRGSLRLISSFERRVELFRSFGIDEVAWLTFGPEMTTMAAEDFVEKILVTEAGAKAVICGYDYRFGSGRGGDARYLQKQGEKYGFSVTVVPSVQGDGGKTISSTVIRQLLSEGELEQATVYLGYYPVYQGVLESEHSAALNVRVEPRLVIPGAGIYLVWCGGLLNQGSPAVAWSGPNHSIRLMFIDGNFVPDSGLMEIQFLYKLRGCEPCQPTDSDLAKARELLPGFHLQDARVVLK